MERSKVLVILCFGLLVIAAQCQREASQVLELDVHRHREIHFRDDISSATFLAETSGVPVVNYIDQAYYTYVNIGTPAQTLALQLDTGSANLWVYGGDCQSAACLENKRFAYKQSSTFKNLEKPLKITYAVGGIAGYLVEDHAELGGITIENQVFGMVQKVYTPWGKHFDGVFGLGFQTLAADNVKPWFINAYEQKLVSSGVFALYLSAENNQMGSKIFLGGVNPAYYTGEITYHDIINEVYYMVQLTGVKVNGENIALKNAKMGGIIDSGTPGIDLPAWMVEAIEAVSGPIESDCSNRDSLPEITFVFDGIDYPISGRDYVLVLEDEDGVETCGTLWNTGKNRPGMPEFLDHNLVIGDPFMKAYVSVFDIENNKLGFAKAKAPSSA